MQGINGESWASAGGGYIPSWSVSLDWNINPGFKRFICQNCSDKVGLCHLSETLSLEDRVYNY